MSSHQTSASGRLYRDFTTPPPHYPFPGQHPNHHPNHNNHRPDHHHHPPATANRNSRTPSSSSGAVSRFSRSTDPTGNGNRNGAPPPPPPSPSPRGQGQKAASAAAGARSELRTSFDPNTDMHLWTMWRVAVNGRIVDDAHGRRRAASPRRGPPREEGGEQYPFGRALVKTPLDRFVKVDAGHGSNGLASLMMDPHHGDGSSKLETKQFVFYGVPRVVLKKKRPRQDVHIPGDLP